MRLAFPDFFNESRTGRKRRWRRKVARRKCSKKRIGKLYPKLLYYANLWTRKIEKFCCEGVEVFFAI